MFENGEMKLNELVSSEPEILKGVIVGKKSWGLWLQEWTDGIVEGTFTEKEILNEFIVRDIKIPDSFLKDWSYQILLKMQKYL